MADAAGAATATLVADPPAAAPPAEAAPAEATPAAAAPAAAAPAVPEGYKILQEGKAKILQKGNDVFYNEAQVTNRDLSVLVLRRFIPMKAQEVSSGKLKPAHKRPQKKGAPGPPPKGQERVKGARLLEGLAASGLRSIRYALEVPQLARVDANDLDPSVVEAMSRNLELNGGDAAAKIRTHCSDARLIMMQNPQTYDAVDLDPYGTPAPLLDTAVQSVADGGLLLITATDMANLCGNNSVACFSNYGSYPVHRPYCHEMALRILLGCLEVHANRYRRHIVPLLSLSVDFYVRVFVRIFTSPAECKETPCRLAYLWQSSGCDSFWLQRVGQRRVQNNSVKYMPGTGPAPPAARCPDTGSGYLMGGPIWAEPIHDFDFVKGLMEDLERDKASYAAAPRIKGLLLSVSSELPDAPLYYDLHDVCKTVRSTPPKSEVFRAALINAGYRVSGSHANPLALKTDAPPSVLWDIVRCWVRTHPAPAAVKDPESYSAKLLAKQPTIEANFKLVAGAVARAKDDKTPRFVQNPAFWGPKARHGRPDTTRPQNGDDAGGDEEEAGGNGGGASTSGAAEAQQQQQQQQGGGGGGRSQKQKQKQRGRNNGGAQQQAGGGAAAAAGGDGADGGGGDGAAAGAAGADGDSLEEAAAGMDGVEGPSGAAGAAGAGDGDGDEGGSPAAKRTKT